MEVRTHRSRTRLEAELPPQRARGQRSVGGHPGEGRWPVTPSKDKDLDSSDSRTTFVILMFRLLP